MTRPRAAPARGGRHPGPVAARRGSETIRDMVLSLGVVAAIVAGFYLLRPPDDPQPIRPVDTGDLSASVAVAARAARWPVLDPVSALPSDWTVTVAATDLPDTAGEGPVVLRLVLVTPDLSFVAVTQTDEGAQAPVQRLTESEAPTGETVAVAGTGWQVWPAAGAEADQAVWSWTQDGRTTVVRGGVEADVRTTAEALVTTEPEESGPSPA